MAFTTPVLPFPPEIRDGEFVLVEQNDHYEIEGCVELIARTPQGYIESLPKMGLLDYTLTRGAPPAGEIRAATIAFEPRVNEIVDSRLVELVAIVTIDPVIANG